MNHLRRFGGSYGRKSSWTKEQIKAGFEHFYDNHGHYPSNYEIDDYEFLPAARTIQRRLRGIKNARRELGLRFDAPDHSSGHIRSEMATSIGSRNKLNEKDFFEFLLSHFPEIQIHEQKRIRPGNILADYFIFTSEDNGVIVDIFYISNIKSLGITLNIKIPKYKNLPYTTYLVVGGDGSISQEEINRVVKSKKTKMPENIKVKEEGNFKKSIAAGEIIAKKLEFAFHDFNGV